MKISITSLVLSIMFSFISMAQDTRAVNLKPFSKVKISHAIEATFIKSSEHSLKAFSDAEVLEDLIIENSNGLLVLKMKPSNSRFKNNNPIRVDIYTPTVTFLQLSGAVKAGFEGFSNFKELKVDISGASNVKIEPAINNFILTMSGASNIKLYGNIDNFKGNISGASRLRNYSSNINSANLEVSGASSVSINASNNLKVRASGASSVSYSGNPRIEKSVSGASSIRKM